MKSLLCRQRVFLCHASEEHDLAAELSASLEAQGHEVFLDRDDLPAGDSYEDRIARAIGRSHLLIFLVSPTSVARGRYTLSELELARAKWKRPLGRILPVVAVRTPFQDLPPSLRVLTVLEPRGNLVAEVSAMVRRLARRRCGRRYLGVGAAALLLAVGAWLARPLLPGTVTTETESSETLERDETKPPAESNASEPGDGEAAEDATEPPPISERIPPPTGEIRDVAFVGYPSAPLREEPGGRRALDQLLWGDWVVLLGRGEEDWVRVWARYKIGWVRRSELQDERLLELYFLAVGSDSGSLLVTPNARVAVIDATGGDWMYHLMQWRFWGESPRIEAAVITHSDYDSYWGFRPILEDERFDVGTLFHYGLVDRADQRKPLGELVEAAGERYVTEIVESRAELEELLEHGEDLGRERYAELLRIAEASPRIGDIRSLSAADGWLPGFGAGAKIEVQVLGPVVETVGGRPALRWFGSGSETKNGHSMVLKISFGEVTVLLAGEMDATSQEALLGHHRQDPGVFRSDVARLQLRGRGNLSERFLRAIDPAATVVIPSLVDTPEALGMVGRAGRWGKSPVLGHTSNLNRELLEPLERRVRELEDRLEAEPESAQAARLEAELKVAIETIQEAIVEVGIVILRTDGERILLASKGDPQGRWRIYRFERGADGELAQV